MAEPTDSSLAFFTKGTAKQWAFVYELRQAAIRAKADQRSSKKGGPEEFIKLDNWYREKLPSLIKSRKEPHVLYDELVQIAKWRLMMGKYRPKMLDLVRINTESSVTGVSRKAYKKVTQAKNIQQAITMLVNLKGIGPSTASAILSAAFPEEAPFMSDEGMLSTPGVEATDSTIAEYVNYSDQLRNKTEWLKQRDPEFKWTPHKVDQALWIYYVARDLKPTLLDAMPRGDHDHQTAAISSSSADAADDNANDCTSSSNEVATNGSSLLSLNHHHSSLHHIHHDEESSESASVPYSEEEISQGASCSSSVIGPDSNSVGAAPLSSAPMNGHHHHHHHHDHHLHHDEDQDHSSLHLLGDGHIPASFADLSAAVGNGHGAISTSSATPVTDSTDHHLLGEALSPVSTTTTMLLGTSASESVVVTTNGTKRPLDGSTNSSGLGEDGDSSKDGLLDSEDSRGDCLEENGGGRLMMMTPSEENSVDDVEHDQPPLKKAKAAATPLQLSTALAAATAVEE